ncbi:MAG: hypothetical protein IKU24_01180, partial [Clostridia bacterium]|nr:hypothetical protein [Clostridia bacterium]
MKRLFLILFSLLFLFGCSAKTNTLHTANSLALVVEENASFFRSCAEEMAFFGEERIYVAMEEKEAADGETLSEEEKKPRLVSYLKESGDREEIENELLEKA